MILPPVWSREELDHQRKRAEQHFRDDRYTEPLEIYLDLFDLYRSTVEEVMEETVDLTHLAESTLSLMADKRKREVFRYLSGPPVSEDDLRVLMKGKSLAVARLKEDEELLAGLKAFMRDWHDRRRFPWIGEERDVSENEREAAVLATSALLAMRRVETLRRNEGKKLQEQLIEQQLLRTGLTKVEAKRVRTLKDAPGKGHFCRETKLGTRKADFLIGLWDGRTMALECKVSNSSTNSVKRLNNDAAVKAEVWRKDFGSSQVVPAAVLSGVYAIKNLEEAQDRGLALFWSHEMQSFVDWLHKTKT